MAQQTKEEIISIIELFLKHNKFRLPAGELNVQMESHPDTGRLNSITDSLDHFNIENAVAEVATDHETIQLLPTHFLAIVSNDDRNSIALATKKKGKIIVQVKAGHKLLITEEEFIELWNGLVILVDEESEMKTDKPDSKWALVLNLGLLAIFTYLIVSTQPGAMELVYLALSLVGGAVFYMLYQYERGEQSGLVEKVCQQGDSNGCGAVLGSDGAELIRGVKLTDLGAIYFVTLLVVQALRALFPEVGMTVLYAVSILALPVTLYSLYYQGVVLKEWCVLCLTTVAILWAQAGFGLFTNPEFFTIPSAAEAITTVMSLLVIAALWYTHKNRQQNITDLEAEKIKFLKMKRNFALFEPSYMHNKLMTTRLRDGNEIVLGNPDPNAEFEVMLITNPTCHHCREAHEKIEQILQQREDIRAVIRFNLKHDNLEDTGVKIAMRLLELYDSKDQDFRLALREAYSTMPKAQWLKKWVVKEAEQPSPLLRDQRMWCQYYEMNFTPVAVVNGRELPKHADIADLPFFIDDIINLNKRNAEPVVEA